jgi:hypothetical protein
MLFITVASASAEHVPKVLQVVEEAKRLRHKNGQKLPPFTRSAIDNF